MLELGFVSWFALLPSSWQYKLNVSSVSSPDPLAEGL